MLSFSPIATFLAKIFHIRREETRSALLMAIFFFVAIASVCLIKSLQNGLYLSHVGVDRRLPLIYILLAILSGPLVLLYRNLTRRFSLLLLTSCTIVFLAVNLIFFWIALPIGEDWVYIVFYFWSAFYAVLLPTQGWFFSYQIYSSRTARRVFSLLGAGGILGGVAGSYYTAATFDLIGSRWLLAHVFVALVVLQILLLIVHSLNRDSLSHEVGTGGSGMDGQKSLRSIWRRSGFRSLAFLVLVAALTSTLVDLLYKIALQVRFGENSQAQLTQFFALLLGTIYLISAVFQLLGTSRILRTAGLGVGLMVLPIALCIGSAGIIITGLVATSFFAVIATKVLDDSLRRSIDRTSVELLYVPIPELQSVTVKSLMELVVARLGDGLGAALFLGILTLSGQPFIPAAIVILVSGGLWVLLTRAVKENYVQTLRGSLEFRRGSAVRGALELDEAVADKTLIAALQSENAEKVLFGLQRLIEGQTQPLGALDIPDLSTETLDMDVTGIYQSVPRPPRWLEPVKAMVGHEDYRVGAAALRLMMLYDSDQYEEVLAETLSNRSVPDRRYLFYLETYEEAPVNWLDPQTVLAWCRSADQERAVLLARLMGKTRDPEYLPILKEWIDSPDRSVRRAAIRALGQYAKREDIKALVPHLAQNWSRRAARWALANYGEEVIPTLMRLLGDPKVDIGIKREIPYILTRINTQSSRAGLVASLYTHDSVVSYRALKGLNRIRDDSDLSYSQESFIPLLQIWAREYYELINIEALAAKEGWILKRLLRRALKERRDWTIERIFRGLELYLPWGDAYFSYRGFTSDSPELRENAIELIDTRIRGELRQTLIPIFSEKSTHEIASEGRNILQLPSNLEDALSDALFGGDPWLKCCIIADVTARKTGYWKERLNRALNDINPLVQQSARWALRDWGEEGTNP